MALNWRIKVYQNWSNYERLKKIWNRKTFIHVGRDCRGWNKVEDSRHGLT